MSKIFFVGDMHIGHAGAIDFDKRPFKDVDEMNEELLKNWNEIVSSEDLVYILGDFLWKNTAPYISLASKMNGRKILIQGNHDRDGNGSYRRLFEEIVPYKRIEVGEQRVVLSHYPILFYEGSNRGVVHFYAHVHNSIEYDIVKQSIELAKKSGKNLRAYNVGIMMDYMNWRPQTMETILSACEKENENGDN